MTPLEKSASFEKFPPEGGGSLRLIRRSAPQHLTEPGSQLIPIVQANGDLAIAILAPSPLSCHSLAQGH